MLVLSEPFRNERALSREMLDVNDGDPAVGVGDLVDGPPPTGPGLLDDLAGGRHVGAARAETEHEDELGLCGKTAEEPRRAVGRGVLPEAGLHERIDHAAAADPSGFRLVEALNGAPDQRAPAETALGIGDHRLDSLLQLLGRTRRKKTDMGKYLAYVQSTFPVGNIVVRQDQKDWRITANPMAWGNDRPEVLVLGFSKGPSQAGELGPGRQRQLAQPSRSG